jgi:hypothetical protein
MTVPIGEDHDCWLMVPTGHTSGLIKNSWAFWVQVPTQKFSIILLVLYFALIFHFKTIVFIFK